MLFTYLHTDLCYNFFSSIVALARITTRGIILIGTCMLFTYLHTDLCNNFFSSIVALARITTRGTILIGTCMLFTYLHTDLCYNFFSSIVAWAWINTRGIILIVMCMLFTYLHTVQCYNFSQQYRCLGKDHNEGHHLDRNVYVIYIPAHRSVLQLLQQYRCLGKDHHEGHHLDRNVYVIYIPAHRSVLQLLQQYRCLGKDHHEGHHLDRNVYVIYIPAPYLCYNFFSSIVAWARITIRGIILIGMFMLFTYLHTDLCNNFSQQYHCLGKDHHEGHHFDRNVYVIYIPAHRSVLQLLSAVSLPGQGSSQGASS